MFPKRNAQGDWVADYKSILNYRCSCEKEIKKYKKIARYLLKLVKQTHFNFFTNPILERAKRELK